ncbi:DUF3883 domain-containing protein [Mucilaginibacter sp. UR6-11]|uniref:DUF3883 domain-containing protein n=1 Tax=Mucilaginibacter sp. UR6-11 TaxID=1435644 RepID=UPI001E312B2D|nr:DUF3883 domain-containing protein [Mucilaginibacter sp. UR6-11]MCC8423584.1 DUF3883 domain-containing protein [Mucilaginibacter sp. UR6-11]
MNHQIRTLLIDQARKLTPITYGDIMKRLGLDHDSPGDRRILSNELYEISKLEHDHKRPLLSSMAMYADLTDHGPGFYELAEDFGFGVKKKLAEEFFGFAEMKRCAEFWKDDEHYKAFYQLAPLVTYNHPFFNERETDFLHAWGGTVYDKHNAEHVAAKNFIISGPGTKTVYWSNALIKLLPGFETFNWRMWSQKGWEDTPAGKKRVARYKTYTWARIYKVGDENKDIFFTVGLDGHGRELVYKMDYYFEKNSHLSAAQKDIVDKNIPKSLRWRSIPVGDFENYDWQRLITLTRDFIAENTALYDKLIRLAWGATTPEEVFSNVLRKQSPPTKGITQLPPVNPSFQANDTDYVAEAAEHKETGDAGEELVKQYEKQKLLAAGRPDLAEQVAIVPNGLGYDVRSFDADGNYLCIEVKTTSAGALTPFYYTINEYIFAERHAGSYFIYRLYNFDDESNTADFYVLAEPLKELLLQPIVYKAYHAK